MDPMHSTPLPSWHVVLPVKGSVGAKTRLAPPPGVDRGALALAMAADTLAAVCLVVPAARVVVVTSDPAVAAPARRTGARVVADPGTGLVAAVGAGLGSLPAHEPRAVLLGDLPALRPEALVAALMAASGHRRSFVADRRGSGTTLITAAAGAEHHPRFGEGSAARHEAAGYSRLEVEAPTLRTDVDDAADLLAVLRLGCGPATTALLGTSVATPS